MNIVIDARAVTNSKTGVGNYIVNLIAGFNRWDKKNRYLIFSSRFRHWIKSIPVASVAFRGLIFCYDNFIFPFVLLFSQTDVYHNPAFILPLFNFGYKKVITIHDLGFYVFGDKFARGWHTRHMRLMLPHSIRQADKIIAVSQATKQQIIDIFKVDPGKIIVTYEGVSEKYRIIQDKAEINKVLQRYNIQTHYILFVGTMDPR
ncbi:MAG: glycosyltransferase, partial [bacterium]|nr:glycosyltransferase [bacterium]